MKHWFNYIAIILLLFATSCEKQGEAEDFYYDYFPIEIGRYVVYDVDETIYDLQTTSEQYQIKELIESEFTDNLGRPSLRVERYKRATDADDWEIKDVWYFTRTASNAEKVEENVRYVKLSFPVRNYQEWDGNIYNTENEWLYYYDSIGDDRTINGLNFDKTIKVVQRDNSNLIEQEEAYEIYAKNIGLIYRKLIDLDFNNSQITGRELSQTVIGYGKE